MSRTQELLEQAQALPHGPERLALVEEAVRQADLVQDGLAGFEARKELIYSADYAAQSDKMLVAFAWCQAYLDEHLEELGWWEQRDLAWYHKWVLNALHHFPQIPLERVRALHDDYARRTRQMGVGAGTVPYFRLALALHRGDHDDARTAFNLWQFAKRDGLSDCPACEAQTIADYHEFLGDDEGCAAQVQKMMDRHMTCSHIPHATHGMVLPALMRLGRWNDAQQHHEQGREMVQGNPDHLTSQARHLEYLSLTDLNAATNWYAQHVPWAERTSELDNRLDYHLASTLYFTALQRQETPQVNLALPQDTPGYRPDGLYDVQERLNHHTGEVKRLAALFDARNGLPHHSLRLERTLALLDAPRP